MSYLESMGDYIFKVIVFGNVNVGKTTLTKRYTRGIFNHDYKKTIGVDFETKKVILDKTDYTLQLWDFSGEERFNQLFGMYLKGANGGLFLFDITQPESLLNMNVWLKLIYQNLPSQHASLSPIIAELEGENFGYSQKHFKIPIIIIASKMDLIKNKELSEKQLKQAQMLRGLGKKIAEAKDFYYGECSSKENININEIFLSLAYRMKQFRDMKKGEA